MQRNNLRTCINKMVFWIQIGLRLIALGTSWICSIVALYIGQVIWNRPRSIERWSEADRDGRELVPPARARTWTVALSWSSSSPRRPQAPALPFDFPRVYTHPQPLPSSSSFNNFLQPNLTSSITTRSVRISIITRITHPSDIRHFLRISHPSILDSLVATTS